MTKELTENQKKDLEEKEKKQIRIKKTRQDFSSGVDSSIVDSEIKELIGLWDKKELTVEDKKRKDDLTLEISKVFSLKSGLWAANLSRSGYVKFLAMTRSMVVDEYKCSTPMELMLADRIVGNYWRSMKLDTTLNHLLEEKDGGFSFNDSKINTIKELSKSLESASRQLSTNIILLKELKQPALNVNVRNAIIGQNQQFNVNKKDDQQENEIIEPK